MDKIEKIKKWVQKKIELYWEKLPDADDEHPTEIQLRDLGQYMAYESMESFLDTLSEKPDKGLEEAALSYVKNKYNFSSELVYNNIGTDDFKAGAEWQKSQILKDAFVADYVAVDDGRIEL